METTQVKQVLSTLDSPSQLKRMNLQELQELAAEIRETIIRTVARCGGHLAPSLGVVELAIALHYVFNTPDDKLIWDVGHQAYAHKLLTGRAQEFHTLRQLGGISGFPKRSESEYDSFGTGHSSTSISSALGMAVGASLKGSTNRVVAVIGDGSMTGGMAFEGLNHGGDLGKNLIVVLNDNEMSISPNVGALSAFLSRKLSNKTLMHLKRDIEGFLRSIPGLGPNILQLIKKSMDSLITLFTPGMLFQAFDFHYIGPIKGHRIDRLIETFQTATHIEGPVLIHVMTQKGRGYLPAECDPTTFHGIGSFNVATGKTNSGRKQAPSYTDVFGTTIVKMAEADSKIVAITAAMPQGTGLEPFSKKFPERFFDVGIAEQHAVTFAAGLAAEGFKPVVAVYSTFMQRAFDQVIHDVCLQKLPVTIALDRSGLVGEDGPTHHGAFDLSFLRQIPNMVLMAPSNENELQHMLNTAINYDGPAAVRYPRGNGFGVPMDDELREIPIGSAELLRAGTDVLLLAIGSTVQPALDAAELLQARGTSAAVLNARFVKPLDEELIMHWSMKTGRILTIEDNVLMGGFGTAVLELFQQHAFQPRQMQRLGLPDAFVPHGQQKELRRACAIDAEGIETTVIAMIGSRNDSIRLATG